MALIAEFVSEDSSSIATTRRARLEAGMLTDGVIGVSTSTAIGARITVV